MLIKPQAKSYYIHQHFNDLAEISDVAEYFNTYTYDGTCNSIDHYHPEATFAITSPFGGSTSKQQIKEAGFTPIASMRNWWLTHSDEWRLLTLWWKQNKDGFQYVEVKQRPAPWSFNGENNMDRYYTKYPNAPKMYHLEDLTVGGCGFKLIQPPLTLRKLFIYFGMVRFLKNQSPTNIEQSTLNRFGYQKFAETSLAEYWANGWKPEEYSMEVEYNFIRSIGGPEMELRNYTLDC